MKEIIRKNKIVIMLLILAVVLSAYISKYQYQLMLIQGESMAPSFRNLQMVVLEKNIEMQELKWGDVIAFKCEGLSFFLVKRIVALPGQSAIIQNSTLYVDGIVSDLYKTGVFEYAGILEKEILLSKNEYIVIGDNISESKDSRYPEIGIVRAEQIIGKIIF